jgi:hypothetical protein
MAKNIKNKMRMEEENENQREDLGLFWDVLEER